MPNLWRGLRTEGSEVRDAARSASVELALLVDVDLLRRNKHPVVCVVRHRFAHDHSERPVLHDGMECYIMKLPTYDMNWWAEAGWAAFITALVFLLTAFVASEGVTDWKVWLIATATGAARAAAGALLSKIVPKPGA